MKLVCFHNSNWKHAPGTAAKKSMQSNNNILDFSLQQEYSHVFNLLQMSSPLFPFMTVYEREPDKKRERNQTKPTFKVFKFKPFVNLHTENFIANAKGIKYRTG